MHLLRDDSKVRRLAELAVLDHLPRRLVRRVAQVADEIVLPAGKVLMRQGDRADAVYLVASGFLDVEADGTYVALLRGGDVVGETGVLDGGRRNATVTAATAAVVFEIPARFFTPLIAESHDLAQRMRHAA
jgi:CRP/FNR family transcriptional regulator, cyclic AMP receptor protein